MHIKNPLYVIGNACLKITKLSYILAHLVLHGINNTAHKNNKALKKCMIKQIGNKARIYWFKQQATNIKS